MAYTTSYTFKRFDATRSIMYVVVNILNDATTPAVVETIDSFPIKLPIDSTGAVLQGTNLNSHITSTLSNVCLLYTSPSPRDQRGSRMPSSA